ncbi:glycosyltransferase 87 family protein [Streptomyces sp. TRM76323]|uniref:Glycosyltransferase 87 family protein n=1 Tax=Streptomyces tamarix TaxID=3078565 RepID=A0ABU3QEX5_9ACTN|nr:glycosyltransferase 87 family protein [Streptomyces tamarix]MDT9681320.1 glycosyltransferase 87 family protein [Streptomyces tamarix]
MTTQRLSTPPTFSRHRLRFRERRRPDLPPLLAVWALSRAAMLWLLAHDTLGIGDVGKEVHVLYRHWYERIASGALPADEATWQYPPGAALVLLAPGTVPGLTYFQGFVALALLADATVLLALARAGGDGAWYWTGGLPLLLHTPLARYDLPVTALAVAALLAVRAGRARLGGALAGLGALAKGWPLLVLTGTTPGPATGRAWRSALATALGGAAVLAAVFPHTLDFLRHQGGRGVQVESAGGTLLSLARLAGWQGRVVYRYGAFEFAGPYVGAVAVVSLLCTGAALLWLVVWRVRSLHWSDATPLDAALAAVLLVTVTSRVISPQYLVWLLGLAAVCLTSRNTTQRPVALLLLPAAALTAFAYPLLYGEVLAVTPLGCLLMLVRNGLLVAAALLSCRLLWGESAPDVLRVPWSTARAVRTP